MFVFTVLFMLLWYVTLGYEMTFFVGSCFTHDSALPWVGMGFLFTALRCRPSVVTFIR